MQIFNFKDDRFFFIGLPVAVLHSREAPEKRDGLFLEALFVGLYIWKDYK